MRRALRFPDRAAAGRALAQRVLEFTQPPSVVLGIPHGGVAVAEPIAALLSAPVGVAWVRKLAAPNEPDVVFGAVDLDGDVTISLETVRAEALSDDAIADIAYHAHQRLLHDWEASPALDVVPLLAGATAVIVDDLAVTGLTLRAAMRWARRQFVREVVLAVPVVDKRIWHKVAGDADRAITLDERDDGPMSRSEVYDDYARISDEAMHRLL